MMTDITKNFQDLKKHINLLKKQRPKWFALADKDLPLINQIKAFEMDFDVELPSDFVDFIMEFGGGYFAFSVIYSLGDGCNWNLYEENKRNKELASGYILFSENSVGDFYGFKIINGVCSDNVYFYDHEIDQWQKSYVNFCTFICEYALSSD